jgi:hypothetical protein
MFESKKRKQKHRNNITKISYKCKYCCASVKYIYQFEHETSKIHLMNVKNRIESNRQKRIEKQKEYELYNLIDKDPFPWQCFVMHEILAKQPDERINYWFYDRTGKTGKSTFIKWMKMKYSALEIPCTSCMFQELAKAESNNSKMDMIIIDIPHDKKTKIDYQRLEMIKTKQAYMNYINGTLLV